MADYSCADQDLICIRLEVGMAILTESLCLNEMRLYAAKSSNET